MSAPSVSRWSPSWHLPASSEDEVSSIQFCTHLSSSWIQNSDKMEKYFMLLALAVTGKTIIVVELVEALYTAK